MVSNGCDVDFFFSRAVKDADGLRPGWGGTRGPCFRVVMRGCLAITGDETTRESQTKGRKIINCV